uniref:Overexpressed in colon carcinoma 1 protein homolog n=1 Tax=Steinernema glaseri TaxID=37863 RepID=A0A1I7XX97_9BILA
MVSCVRQLDPVYEPVPPSESSDDDRVLHEFKHHDYKSVNEYYDDDIEKALRQLQESRDMLGESKQKENNCSRPSPQMSPKKSLLEQESPRLKSNLFTQFPSMNRSGLSTN